MMRDYARQKMGSIYPVQYHDDKAPIYIEAPNSEIAYEIATTMFEEESWDYQYIEVQDPFTREPLS